MPTTTSQYNTIRAITALLGGFTAFAIIAYSKYMVLLDLLTQRQQGLLPVGSVSIYTQLFVAGVAMLAISAAIMYLRSQELRFRMLSRIGMFWAITAVILCFLPMSWLL